MTSPENNLAQNPQELEENVTSVNEFDGIADERFKEFITGVADELV